MLSDQCTSRSSLSLLQPSHGPKSVTRNYPSNTLEYINIYFSAQK